MKYAFSFEWEIGHFEGKIKFYCDVQNMLNFDHQFADGK